MRPGPAIHPASTRVELTDIPDSWAWMWPDILIRLIPFGLVYGAAYRLTSGAAWLGLSTGNVGAQLVFAAIGVPLLFVAAAGVQLLLTRRRHALRVPSGPGDASFQAGFYALNGPLEEAFFRGLLQGGLTALLAAPVGFAVATTAYVLYHRLGSWRWSDTCATALLGVPVGLAYWLLPGPPSLLGVSLVHIAATCGFLGPGPYLLQRFGFLGSRRR